VLTNADLEQMVDTTDAWIRERTGISKRHLVANGETTASMAEAAARQALAMAGRSPEDLDLIILATTTPDQLFPSTACLLQQRLGVQGCPAFDIQAVCTGFIYALTVAEKFIKTGTAKCALVIGAEMLSKIVDWTDRSTCVLFGDGAGAVVLEPSEETGILASHIHADGSYENLLRVPGGLANPEAMSFIEMRGNEVFRVAVTTLGRIVDQTLEAAGLEKTDIDWLIPHQANIRIIQATAKKLRMGMGRVVVTVDQHGNTSAASVPLALDTAVRDGRVKRGETLLMEAFGGGFTWGSVLTRF
jgi:3-oxoacyl-[acyl-carrier-protein] synthase-3